MDTHANAQYVAALDAAGELVFPLSGSSMGSAWAASTKVVVTGLSRRAPRVGDVVVFERCGRIYSHRLIARWGGRCVTKGDARWAWDRPHPRENEVFGVATALVGPDGVRRPIRRARWTAVCQLARALLAWPALLAWGCKHRGASANLKHGV